MSLVLQRFTLSAILIAGTAYWTPWWGTILVAFIMAYLSGFSTGLLTLASFAGWIMALLIRDLSNEQGPSRILVRLFSLTTFSDLLAQSIVIAAIALIGACLGGAAAGLVHTIKIWRRTS